MSMLEPKDMSRLINEMRELIYRVNQNCTNCAHFSHDNDTCKLNGQRPPARIIVRGCEMYADEIPF